MPRWSFVPSSDLPVSFPVAWASEALILLTLVPYNVIFPDIGR